MNSIRATLATLPRAYPSVVFLLYVYRQLSVCLSTRRGEFMHLSLTSLDDNPILDSEKAKEPPVL